ALLGAGAAPAAAADLTPGNAEPFQVAIQTFTQATGAKLFTVPDGKRAVIEHVSVTCSDLKQVAAGVLHTDTSGVGAPHVIPLSAGGGGTYTGAHSLRVYADSGSYVSMSAANYESGTYTCFYGSI